VNDFASSLEQGLPQAWRPDQGGEDNPNPLIGTFVEMTTATTAYGPTWVMTVRLEDGSERAVWLMHTVLRNELARARPKPGETLGIKYNGKVAVEGGQGYVSYRVKVDRPLGEAFDWSKIGADPEIEELPDAPSSEVESPVAVPATAGEDDIPF
jgi:hypothetical protein